MLESFQDASIPIAVASRSPTPHLARRYLHELGLFDRFIGFEVYPSNTGKDKHLNALSQATGVEHADMVFFDGVALALVCPPCTRAFDNLLPTLQAGAQHGCTVRPCSVSTWLTRGHAVQMSTSISSGLNSRESPVFLSKMASQSTLSDLRAFTSSLYGHCLLLVML